MKVVLLTRNDNRLIKKSKKGLEILNIIAGKLFINNKTIMLPT